MVRQGRVRFGGAGLNLFIWHGGVGYGVVRCGEACQGLYYFCGEARFGLVRRGGVWYGEVGFY